MSKIWPIAWNDIRIEFADRSTLIFFLILPLVFTAIVGQGLSGGSSNGDNRVPVLVVDEDNSTISQQLLAAMSDSQVIRPLLRPRAEADALFAEQSAPVLLTIPAGLGQALLAGEKAELDARKISNDSRVLAVEQALLASAIGPVSNAISAAQLSVTEAEKLRPFASDSARQAYRDEAITLALEALRNPPARIETTRSEKVNAQVAQGFEQASPGQLVTWVLITLVGAAEVVVNERLGGTLRRLLTTPTSQATILAGKITGRLILGVAQMALLIGFGALVLKVNWGRSLPALALVILAFALSAVAFGVLLGTLAKTRSQASGLTILFSMLPAALGGAWWPLEVTPKVYQTVVQALPTTWAMKGFGDVIIRGEGVAGVLPEVSILLGFALVFFFIGIRRFRFE